MRYAKLQDGLSEELVARTLGQVIAKSPVGDEQIVGVDFELAGRRKDEAVVLAKAATRGEGKDLRRVWQLTPSGLIHLARERSNGRLLPAMRKG